MSEEDKIPPEEIPQQPVNKPLVEWLYKFKINIAQESGNSNERFDVNIKKRLSSW